MDPEQVKAIHKQGRVLSTEQCADIIKDQRKEYIKTKGEMKND